MSKIGIVIEREYLERVKKKSFIITTILMPILMLALMMAPAAIMLFVDSSESKVLVVDNSKMIAQKLKDREDVKFELAHDITLDSALNREDVSSVLVIPANVINAQRSTLKLYSNGPSSITTESAITDQVVRFQLRYRYRHGFHPLHVLAHLRTDGDDLYYRGKR